MLVDGLGHDLLAEHRAQAPYLHSLLGSVDTQPATCGVPSTTATSLTSLGTALTPGQHGLVGFTSRVPETGALLNSLFWDQPVDPLVWQPHRTAFDALEAVGVHTSVVSKREFAASGLTRCGQRGAAYVGADDVAERVAGAVAAAARRPSLTYVYDGDLDWHGHRAGVDSVRWRAQLRDIDEDVQELRDALPPEVRLVVVADHGMVDSLPQTRFDIDSEPSLRDGVSLLGGEARFRHVYCHLGAAPEVAATWREVLGSACPGPDAGRGDRPRVVRHGRRRRTPPDRRRRRRRRRQLGAVQQHGLLLRDHPDRPARLPDPPGDAHPHPGLLTPQRHIHIRTDPETPTSGVRSNVDMSLRRRGGARRSSRWRGRGRRSSGGGGGPGRGPRRRPRPPARHRWRRGPRRSRRRRRSPRPR